MGFKTGKQIISLHIMKFPTSNPCFVPQTETVTIVGDHKETKWVFVLSTEVVPKEQKKYIENKL